MRKFFEFGGVVAAAVLIAFGITAIAMGVSGREPGIMTRQVIATPPVNGKVPTCAPDPIPQLGIP